VSLYREQSGISKTLFCAGKVARKRPKRYQKKASTLKWINDVKGGECFDGNSKLI
jgi:hypothetical protein